MAEAGFDAVAEIIRMLGTEISQSLRAKLLCELMEYQYSKRKHIEVSGEDGGQLRLIVEIAYVRPGDALPTDDLVDLGGPVVYLPEPEPLTS